MRRYLLSQLRFRWRRTAFLAVGVLVPAVTFTLLTSAVQTSALEVRGDVEENWRTAYDVLVRPPGSFTSVERERGLVRENYLAALFGGITREQYREISTLPGVEVAAPIANVGYIAPHTSVPVPLGNLPTGLYRLRTSWTADRGLSRYPGAYTQYIYVTDNELVQGDYGPREILPGRDEPVGVCDEFNARPERRPESPLDLSETATAFINCFSTSDGRADPAIQVSGQLPLLVAAIDPDQEDLLLDLNATVVSGRPLRGQEPMRLTRVGQGTDSAALRTLPAIAAVRSYVDQALEVEIERLEAPAGTDTAEALGSEGVASFLANLRGTTIGTETFGPQVIHERLLAGFDQERRTGVDGYFEAADVAYDSLPGGALAARPTVNPASVYENPSIGSLQTVNGANADTQFRALTPHPYSGSMEIAGGVSPFPVLQIVGEYDPELLPGFSPLSRVPLETYYPPQVEPADAASRAALGGQTLAPSMNLGGYVAQPPLILTTLEAAEILFDADRFEGAHEQAPISAVRVRVAGADGPDRVSQERIRQVATAIVERTGLAVDVTAGSSPQAVQVQLPAGRFGRPPLLLQEGWVEKGVAVRLLTAVDRKSLALFLLVLVVSAGYLANSAFAAVRTRRTEIGTLLALGWTRRSVFIAVLGELALVGLGAGTVGTVLAAAAVALLDLDLPLLRTVLVAPVAVALTVVGGLVPAWGAARHQPLDSIRPPATGAGSARPVRGVVGMAVRNVVRVPGRTLLGASGLAVSVAALTFLAAVTLAFQGSIVGNLLGAFVSVQVRPVDYLAVGCTTALGALAVADVLFLNLQERAAELATLRTLGWTDRTVTRLVGLEGLLVAVAATLSGAAVGVAAASAVGGVSSGTLLAGGLATGAGIALSILVAAVAAAAAGRTTVSAALAEE